MFRDGADGVATNDLSKYTDEICEVGLGDMNRRPKSSCELLLGDKMLRTTDKTEQRVESAGLQPNDTIGTAKQAIGGMKLKFPEAVGGIDRTLIFV